MRFDAEHRFQGSPRAVAEVLSDPDFYTGLELPDVSLPTLLDSRQDGDRSVVALRYEFVGNLDPIGRRLLGSHRLSWTQEVCVDTSSASGTLNFKAEADPKRLHGAGEFRLIDERGVTLRRLSGELVIAVPVIGPAAERKIVPGLLRRLDVEAQAVAGRLAGAKGSG